MRSVSANPDAGAQPISELQAFADAQHSGRPFLRFHDREGRQQLFFLPADATASVGRQTSSDVVIDWDNQVSRTHARFERSAQAWVVVDDGLSSNGTFVNDELVSGRRQLNDGDSLRFGSTIVTFHSPAPEPPPPPPAPAPPPPAAAPSPPGPPPPRPAIDLSSTQRRVLAALCRPYKGGQSFATPASDEEIAEELVLAAGEVRAHLRILAAKLGIERLPHAELRVRLAERAFSTGLIQDRDL